MNSMDFRLQGSCRDHDPELFFPPSESSFFAAQIDKAKAVCVSCPVFAECSTHALTGNGGVGEEFGIWAGMTESERRGLRRKNIKLTRVPASVTSTPRSTRPSTRRRTPEQAREYDAANTQLNRARNRLAAVRAQGDPAAIREVEERVAAAEQRLANARITKPKTSSEAVA